MILRPPPNRTADQWACQNRVLPLGNSEPGPFRYDRTPYAIPIIRAINDPRYSTVVAVMSSQMAKTEIILNSMGHRADDDPAPMLYVGPTRTNVEKVIEPRLMAMINSAPGLSAKLARGQKSSKTNKAISGISIRLAWSGSPTELAAQAAATVFVDERDRMVDLPLDGDVVTLADARHSTYADGTTVVTSSPLSGNVEEQFDKKTGLTHWKVADPDDLQSPVWKLWQQGTRYEWAWPCPDCKDYFIPRFKLLHWPDGCTPHQALKKARLTCPNCGTLIADHHKKEMNKRGVYVAPGQTIEQDGTVVGTIPRNATVSYWVSGLCSPWRTFGQRAQAWLNAVLSGEPGRIQAVLNTGFGELYRLGANSPDWQIVLNHKQPYKSGDIPAGMLALAATVDVQKNRLVYVVRAWGYGFESWMVECGELWGETEHNAVWVKLENLLLKTYDNHKIMLMLIDSGFKPGKKETTPDNKIYDFCRKFPGVARPTKGHAQQDKPIKATSIDVTYKGRIIKNGLQLWHLDTNFIKSFVYSKLEPAEGEPDLWHVPEDVTEDYCKQVTAEAPVVKPSGQVVWIRNRKDNHYLDCESMQVAAAYMLRIQDMAPAPVVTLNTNRIVNNNGTFEKDGILRRKSNYL
jgi:phage terminase large subunit GpA-like protein